MTKYFCYRKHPEKFIGRGPGHTIYGSFPAYREYMSYEQWLERGQPTGDDIVFYGVGKGNWKRYQEPSLEDNQGVNTVNEVKRNA